MPLDASAGVPGVGEAAAPRGPCFDQAVPPGGYLWWYVDAVSDDGLHALTVIAFVGSVFSPYYAWAGRRDPDNHCTLNVALYGPEARWAMTERGRGAVRRLRDSFTIGPSAMRWVDGALEIDIDERGFPLPRRVRGRVVLTPGPMPARRFTIDAAGRHVWQPVAPCARVAVEFAQPDLIWNGHAYHDSNFGCETLSAGFSSWSWARGRVRDGVVIYYDSVPHEGAPRGLALHCGTDGVLCGVAAPPMHELPRGMWGVARRARGEVPPVIARKFEDAPFYTRSLIRTQLGGKPADMVHESLRAGRLDNVVVQAMLPFRMPRMLF